MTILLDKRCDVKRFTEGKNAFGGTSRGSSATVATSVRCRRHQVKGEESNGNSGARGFTGDHRMWVPYGTDVTVKDQVLLGGTTYEVMDVDPDMAGRGLFRVLGLVEVRA